MSMITRGDLERALHVVDSSRAAEMMARSLRTDARGAKGQTPLHCRLFLIGAVLNAGASGNFVIKDIHETLTVGLPLDDQFTLGVRQARSGGRVKTLTINDFYNLTRKISKLLGYGTGEHPDLTDDDRARRRSTVDGIVTSLLAATQVPMSSGSFAIDGSGVWAWSVGRRRPKPADDEPQPGGEDSLDVPLQQPPTKPSTATRKAQGPAPCRDATWGYKTARVGGREIYFGYQLHAIVNVPKLGEDRRDAPTLIADFDVTPANEDIVDVSLSLIDRLTARGVGVRELLADRHYSHKVPDRWALQLEQRGVAPVLDLHQTDQGWSEYEGSRLAAGVPHCPSSPDDLGNLPSPSPNESKEVHSKHHMDIAARQELAFTRNGRTAAGNPRFMCPARAGNVGCRLVAGSVPVAITSGLRVVQDVPLNPGKCCTQTTITLQRDTQRKVWQEHYWRGAQWRKSYARRTYVEGVFGQIKNASTENVARGHFRITGLTLVRLALAAVAVSYNIRQLRDWHEEFGTGPDDHPLLQVEPECHGWRWLLPEEARDLSEHHLGEQLPMAA